MRFFIIIRGRNPIQDAPLGRLSFNTSILPSVLDFIGTSEGNANLLLLVRSDCFAHRYGP
jgi:hypothetical protein